MRAAVVTTSPISARRRRCGPSARSVSYQNCRSSGNSSGLMAVVSVVFLPSLRRLGDMGFADTPGGFGGSCQLAPWRVISGPGRPGGVGGDDHLVRVAG